MTSQSYPLQDPQTAGPQYGYQFDAMGRTSSMTGPPYNLTIATAAYGPAGELTSLNGDTRSYNILGQLTRITGGGIDLEYVYTAGQNNGRIAQQIDHVSGEQVTYQYDQLNRLSHAETLDNSWGYTYTYDGFGNLTGKIVTKGAAIPGMTGFTAAYDPATNHGSGYDANGNAPVNGECPSGGCYDVENRLRNPFVAPSWGFYILGSGNYVYDPWGKRVAWRHETDSSDTGLETKCELYIYGISGQRVASYGCGYQAQDGGGSVFQWTLKGYNVYFAGHMIQSNGVSVTTDRLGSVRKNGNSETFKYLPYGEELTSTPDGREKFATYLRDSGVGGDYGLDYADQRYYDRGSGRFLTPDPGGVSTADPMNPRSWNRYAYANGDPINFYDPHGRVTLSPDFCEAFPELCSGDGGNDGTGGGDSSGMQTIGGNGGKASDPGGGDGSTALAKAVANTIQKIGGGVAAALAALANPNCAALFNLDPSAPDPTTLLSQASEGKNPQVYFTEGFILSQSSGTMTNATTQMTSYSLQNGTITYTGVANKTVVVFNYDPNAPFNTGSTTDAAVTVLHELGHVYEFLYGLGSTFLVNDSIDAQGSKEQANAASAYNTQLVKANCFPGGH